MIDNPDWMAALKDDTLLSQLSIPGTHDTMSFYGGDIVQTQSLSLRNQLQSGVRVLDIRCRHIQNVFAIHHGPIFQRVFFGDVLNTVVDFLQKHPGEAVLMRVREEYRPEKTTRTFEETFKNEYWNRWRNYFWMSTSDNPTLGTIRRKIVILQDFRAASKYGISYETFAIQDKHNLRTNWDLYDKWTAVKNHLSAADRSVATAKYMNYLSGSGGSFPYFVSSGHSSPGTSAPRLATGRTTPAWKNSWPDFPRVGCFIGICTIAFEGTNVLTYHRIINYRRVGIIMADFPGPSLIKGIIDLNRRFKNQEFQESADPDQLLRKSAGLKCGCGEEE